MAISDNYVPIKLLGNGVTVNYTGNWPIIVPADLKVYKEAVATGVQTLLVNGVDYNITSYTAAGWALTMTAALSNAFYFVAGRGTALEQQTIYSTAKGFDGSVNETSFDRLTAMQQEALEKLTRAILFPLGSTSLNLTMPAPSAGKALRWKDDLSGLQNSVDDVDGIVTAATAQAVIATAQAVIATTQAGLAAAARVAADADAVATAADRVQTGLDKVATAADRVQTGLDVVSSAASAATATTQANTATAKAVLTAADALATAADRVQTGLDRTAAANSAAAAATSETNAAASAAKLTGTSVTSLTIGTGTKSFVTQAGKFFDVGNYVLIVSDANPSTNFMFGQVTAYAGTALDVNVLAVGGAGTLADWTIRLAGARGATGASGSLDFAILAQITDADATADMFVLLDATDSANKKILISDIFKSIADLTAETAVDTADVILLYDASAATADKATVNELFKAISTFTAMTDVDTADVLHVYDVSGSASKKATVNEIFDAVNTFTAETAVDTADIVYLYDASASTSDKATINNVFKAVNTFTAETSVDTADVLFLYDSSASTADKCTVAELFKAVNTLTADGTPDTAADYVLSYDTSAGAAKKVLMNLIGSTGYYEIATYATNADLSTTIPKDDTVPTSSEGTQILSITRTTATTKKVVLSFSGSAAAAASVVFYAVLYKNGTAVAAAALTGGSVNLMNTCTLEYSATGSGNNDVWTVRVGLSSGTCRMNGTTTARELGGIMAAALSLTEI